jgi:hypothetical protein
MTPTEMRLADARERFKGTGTKGDALRGVKPAKRPIVGQFVQIEGSEGRTDCRVYALAR